MPVERVPGFFDYLGQGFGNFAQARQAKTAREDEQDRQHLDMVSRMVSSGQMDASVANADPVVAKSGMKFAPSPQELARRIASSPMGQPGTAMPDLSKYFATPGSIPTGAGSMDAVPAPVMDTKLQPWSPDQRALAGMPSAGAVAGDELATRMAGIKSKYLADPNSISPTEASAAGVKTPAQLQTERQTQLEPTLTAAAGRHVDELINSSGLDISDPKALRAKATVLSNSAYQNWLKEAQANGSLSSMTPEDRNYARTFFSSAMNEKVSEAVKYKQRMNEIYAGRAGQNDKSVQVAELLNRMGDSTDKQADQLEKMAGDRIWLVNNKLTAEGVQAAVNTLRTKTNSFRAGGVKAISGKIDPAELQSLLNNANTTGSAANQQPPTGGQPDKSPEIFNAFLSQMRLIPKERQATELENRKHLMSDTDYKKAKKALGIADTTPRGM